MSERMALLLAALLVCSPALPQSSSGPAAGTTSTPTQTPTRGTGMRRGPPGGGPMGAWWRNSEIVTKVGLSEAQVRQVEQIFQDHRAQLMTLHLTLRQEQARLQPLVDAEHPDESQVLAQIDKVAMARAELEKANSRMLFAVRGTLTMEQWKKLKDLGQGMGQGTGMGMGPGMGMGRGPGAGRPT